MEATKTFIERTVYPCAVIPFGLQEHRRLGIGTSSNRRVFR